jgi:hypothetical protein
MSRRGRIGGSRSTAFTIATTSEIQSAITLLYGNMQKTLPHPMLTHDEVLSMFAPPEDIVILKEATKIAAVSHYYAESSLSFAFTTNEGGPIGVSFQLNGDRGTLPLLPKVPKLQPGFEARAEEIRSWGNARIELAFEWGLVRRFFDRLNRKCSRPAQVRYIWPTLLGVMRSYGGGLVESLAKLEEFKRPPELPTLSPEFVEVGRRCTQIVTTALIMNDTATVDQSDVPVRLSVGSSGLKRLHQCEDIGSYGPISG